MRHLYRVEDGLPLIGHIAFGLIDRGTNLLQVRPTSLCPLSCVFCSVDAGPKSKTRISEFLVSPKYLVEWFTWAVRAKKLENAHAYIDAVGDPLTHPQIVDLVRLLRKTGLAASIAVETHGTLLTEKLVDELEEAGLERINLSIDALDPLKAKQLSGSPWFDVERVKRVAEYVVTNTTIDLLVAPVWVPGYNDDEIPRIIEWALRIGAGKRWPPLGVQKYEVHKYGRKVPGVKPMRWGEFYRALRKWEREYGVKLVLKPDDFGIARAARIPLAFEEGENTVVRIVGPGWLRGQWLGVSNNRVVTVVGVESDPPVGARVRVKVVRNRDNIYIARLLET